MDCLNAQVIWRRGCEGRDIVWSFRGEQSVLPKAAAFSAILQTEPFLFRKHWSWSRFPRVCKKYFRKHESDETVPYSA